MPLKWLTWIRNKELGLLNNLWQEDKKSSVDISSEFTALKEINEKIWDIEDDIRDKERAKEFDEKFIELARSVYFSNDKRAEINMKLGSELIEEKSYSDYTWKFNSLTYQRMFMVDAPARVGKWGIFYIHHLRHKLKHCVNDKTRLRIRYG